MQARGYRKIYTVCIGTKHKLIFRDSGGTLAQFSIKTGIGIEKVRIPKPS